MTSKYKEINSEPSVNGSELKRNRSGENELSCRYREANERSL